jgi:uncharacterized membrane protein (DUF485 family)
MEKLHLTNTQMKIYFLAVHYFAGGKTLYICIAFCAAFEQQYLSTKWNARALDLGNLEGVSKFVLSLMLYFGHSLNPSLHYNKDMTIFHEKCRDIFIFTCCFHVVVHDNNV